MISFYLGIYLLASVWTHIKNFKDIFSIIDIEFVGYETDKKRVCNITFRSSGSIFLEIELSKYIEYL